MGAQIGDTGEQVRHRGEHDDQPTQSTLAGSSRRARRA